MYMIIYPQGTVLLHIHSHNNTW